MMPIYKQNIRLKKIMALSIYYTNLLKDFSPSCEGRAVIPPSTKLKLNHTLYGKIILVCIDLPQLHFHLDQDNKFDAYLPLHMCLRP